MAPSDKRRFWHTCRVCFRRVRICAWTLLLVLLGALWYLNHVGLPGFLKRPILEKLTEYGRALIERARADTSPEVQR